MVNWALGYISGAAIWGGVGDPLRPTDANGVFYWLDNYCRTAAAGPLREAIDAFITDAKATQPRRGR